MGLKIDRINVRIGVAYGTFDGLSFGLDWRDGRFLLDGEFVQSYDGSFTGDLRKNDIRRLIKVVYQVWRRYGGRQRKEK